MDVEISGRIFNREMWCKGPGVQVSLMWLRKSQQSEGLESSEGGGEVSAKVREAMHGLVCRPGKSLGLCSCVWAVMSMVLPQSPAVRTHRRPKFCAH